MTIPTVEARRFSVGKYEIVATPMANSAHMLRYTIFVQGRRIGATVSVPTEADCRFIESPPPVPALVPYQNVYRPGRPKKGAAPRTYEAPPAPREELPQEIAIPRGED